MDQNEKAADYLAKGIEALAQKLEHIAPQVWDIMVRQQKIDAYISLSFLTLSLVVSTCVILKLKKYWHSEDEDWQAISTIASCVLAFLTLLFVLFNAPQNINQLINPEYYAIKDLVYMVR